MTKTQKRCWSPQGVGTAIRLRMVNGTEAARPVRPVFRRVDTLIQVMQTRVAGAAAPTSRLSC
jgi:hypothetical protein